MSSVFSFGSVILDENYTIPEGLNMMMSAKVFQTINKEIALENKKLKTQGEASIPKIDSNSTKNINDDRLYPVLKRVAERLKGNLNLNKGPGGSVHNAQQALKATLGRYLQVILRCIISQLLAVTQLLLPSTAGKFTVVIVP